jgi:hypothetical protein
MLRGCAALNPFFADWVRNLPRAHLDQAVVQTAGESDAEKRPEKGQGVQGVHFITAPHPYTQCFSFNISPFPMSGKKNIQRQMIAIFIIVVV